MLLKNRVLNFWFWVFQVSLVFAQAPSRDVYLLCDFNPLNIRYSMSNDVMLISSHASVHIMGDDNDGPLRVQIVDYGVTQLTVDAIDYGKGSPNPSPKGSDPGSQSQPRSRQVRLLGQTTLTNAEFIDINKNGAGLLAEITTDPNGLFKGQYVEGEADCMDFARELLKRTLPQLGDYPELDEWVSLWKTFVPFKYLGTGRSPATGKLQLAARQVTAYGDATKNVVTLYDFVEDGKTQLVSQGPQQANTVCQDTAETPEADPDPIADQWSETRPAGLELGHETVPSPFSFDDSGPGYRSPFEEAGSCKRAVATRLGRRCAAGTGSGVSEIAIARVQGALSTVTLVSNTAAEAAGIAGALLGAVFVVLDFADGNWVGGAIGAAGLGLGIAASLTLAGPVGWIIGGAIAALFAILPGLFSNQDSLPAATNITQIIQWRMFGDADHTGNEQCRKQNPDCQAAYGPGVIATAFGWDDYDATVFLINFNKGFPMTIPDMSSAFQFNGTQGAEAIVDCHNGKWVLVGGHSAAGGYEGDNPKWCNHPQFSMSRTVVLPIVNQTAAQVFNRIIPAPGGDCKIIDGASNAMDYTAYNLTVTGLPVSITCNISATINYQDGVNNGTSSPPTTNSNGTLISPANSSTADIPGGYIAPPPPAPFVSPFGSTNVPCFSGTTGQACFPNGTYDQPDGTFGFTLTGVTQLTIPAGSGATVTMSRYIDGHRGWATHTFTETTTPPQTSNLLTNFISMLNNLNHHPQFSVNVPAAPPPAACLFTKPQYGGDQFYYGVGGGNLTAPMANTAHSIQVFGGATVWIYAASYGDEGGQKVTVSVPDLSTEPYGTGGNFGGKVMALWVEATG